MHGTFYRRHVIRRVRPRSAVTSRFCRITRFGNTPLGGITPIPLKWTAKLPGSLLGGNFTALPRIPLANLDIPEPKARQHAGKRLACIFVGDLQDAVLQCGCLKLALSFLAYLAFKIRIGRGKQSGVA